MYQIILRFGSYANAPKPILFVWRWMHFIAKKMDYPIILLGMYGRLEQLLFNSAYDDLLSRSLFSEDGVVSPAPVFLKNPES